MSLYRIVQEYVLARQIIIHRGSESISGEVFGGALEHIRRWKINTREDRAHKVSHHRLHPEEHTLAALILAYAGSEATNPRDRVYALLHLAIDVTSEDFVVDYEKSVLEILFEVSLFLCWNYRHKQDFDLFATLSSLRFSLDCTEIANHPSFALVDVYLGRLENSLLLRRKQEVVFNSFKQVIGIRAGDGEPTGMYD